MHRVACARLQRGPRVFLVVGAATDRTRLAPRADDDGWCSAVVAAAISRVADALNRHGDEKTNAPRCARTHATQQRQAQPRVALAEAHAQREATTTTAAAKEPESVFVYRSDDYFGGSGAKAVDAAALDAADAAPQMIPASWWQRWAADSADDAERNDTAARARRRAPEEANASVSSAAAAGGGGGGAHRGVLDKQLERELDLAAAAGRVALFPRGGARTDRGALVAGLASPMAQFVDM